MSAAVRQMWRRTYYAPVLNGVLIHEELATQKEMTTWRKRERLRTRSGRISNTWGPWMTWREYWLSKGARIRRVRVEYSVTGAESLVIMRHYRGTAVEQTY